MEKKFRITVEGKQYIVAVEDISTEGAQNLYPDAGQHERCSRQPALRRSPTATPAGGFRRPRCGWRPGDEVAPLGGVVQTVHVSVGQVVNEGDKLVSLEAMKMVTHVDGQARRQSHQHRRQAG
jgi:biotin carboxyl carrier protein